MQLSNEIIEIFSNLKIKIKPKNIPLLENVLKIYKANTENKITKTVKTTNRWKNQDLNRNDKQRYF